MRPRDFLPTRRAMRLGLLLLAACLPGTTLSWADPPRNALEATTRRGIWDGTMTQGVTGLGWEIPDKGDSTGKSGIPKEERLYYIPSHAELNRLGDDVERDALASAGRIRRYSPDALLQCQLDWRAGAHALSKGYYLASLGDDGSGSARVHGPGWAPASSTATPLPTSSAAPTTLASPPSAAASSASPSNERTTIILQRQGRVAAVLPIDRVAAYQPEKGEPSARRPFARIEQTEDGPLLRFYYKDRIYSSPLAPAPAALAPPRNNDLPPLTP